MNNLDHVKNFYPENYKLDLSETMKAALSKSSGGGVRSDISGSGPGVGYVTEKLYLYLQLYLQNKGWNPELKDAMLPSAAYLQVLANRLTLDQQGRLILRENGKIVLPFEHFANAVMLKHMSGPHGIHLSLEATVRAVIESYTIGRENFGMEKEFIIEVVQSCPSPACRYYKSHMGLPSLPFLEQQFPGVNPAEFLHLSHLPPPTASQHGNSNVGGGSSSSAASTIGNNSMADIDLKTVAAQHSSAVQSSKHQHLSKHQQNTLQTQLQNAAAAAAAVAQAQQQQQQHQQQQQQQQQAALAKQQQQLAAALIHQQNRALAQQSLEKFSNLSALEKQRILQQLDPKHFDSMAAAAAAAPSSTSTSISSSTSIGSVNTNIVTGHSHAVQHHLPPPPQSPNTHAAVHMNVPHSSSSASTPLSSSSSSIHSNEQLVAKSSEFLRSNLDTLESNKDLLALHNGSWSSTTEMNRNSANNDVMPVGQDKIVRVFAELMRNMARMKTYIRPSMCKPYGKQSESLQKTLLDTIQIVQTLRNCLPAPHIPVTSWKSESEGGNTAVIAGIPANTLVGNNATCSSAVSLNVSRLEN